MELTEKEVEMLAKFIYNIGWISYEDLELNRLLNKILYIARQNEKKDGELEPANS